MFDFTLILCPGLISIYIKNEKYKNYFDAYLKLFKYLTHIWKFIEYNINNQGESILEERVYKENLKRMILEMAQDEISNYSSQKGVQKYFEGNIDKIINENIKNYLDDISVNKIYSKILKRGSSQENVQSVARVIKSEELFKSKNELIKFARYLGINVNAKSSYTQTLKRLSNYIYLNRKEYSEKYVLYRNGDEECILEPEKIKLDLIESYKSKTRKDMKSIARLLDINVEDEESAEDIRRKVINYIMKEKLTKKK